MTTILKCEVNTLGYPQAALFGFCVALVASNVLATLRASLRAVHGVEKEENVSLYYLADELAGLFRGMAVALPTSSWEPVRNWDLPRLANWLKELGAKVKLSRFKKHRRGPKKPRVRRTRFTREKHISTAKLLAAEKVRKTSKTDP